MEYRFFEQRYRFQRLQRAPHARPVLGCVDQPENTRGIQRAEHAADIPRRELVVIERGLREAGAWYPEAIELPPGYGRRGVEHRVERIIWQSVAKETPVGRRPRFRSRSRHRS